MKKWSVKKINYPSTHSQLENIRNSNWKKYKLFQKFSTPRTFKLHTIDWVESGWQLSRDTELIVSCPTLLFLCPIQLIH